MSACLGKPAAEEARELRSKLRNKEREALTILHPVARTKHSAPIPHFSPAAFPFPLRVRLAASPIAGSIQRFHTIPPNQP